MSHLEVCFFLCSEARSVLTVFFTDALQGLSKAQACPKRVYLCPCASARLLFIGRPVGDVQRRVNAMVEMAFLLYRCVLPVPVWIEYYSRDNGYFAAVYLVLKVKEDCSRKRTRV